MLFSADVGDSCSPNGASGFSPHLGGCFETTPAQHPSCLSTDQRRHVDHYPRAALLRTGGNAWRATWGIDPLDDVTARCHGSAVITFLVPALAVHTRFPRGQSEGAQNLGERLVMRPLPGHGPVLAHNDEVVPLGVIEPVCYRSNPPIGDRESQLNSLPDHVTRLAGRQCDVHGTSAHRRGGAGESRGSYEQGDKTDQPESVH